MRQKREAAVDTRRHASRAPGAAAAREPSVVTTAGDAGEDAAAEASTKAAAEVVPYLRSLGFRAKHAAALAIVCEAIPDAPLEERVRAALKAHGRARLGLAG